MREYKVKVLYFNEKEVKVSANSLKEAKKLALKQSNDIKGFKKDAICVKMAVLPKKV